MTSHDDFELKRSLDALPREIEPPAGAWTGIRARLKGGERGTGNGERHSAAWFKRPRTLRIAALLTLLAISAGALVITRHNAGTWHLATTDGSRVFRAGEQLATGAGGAVMQVGNIGTVRLDSVTSVRLIESRATAHRLALARGTLHAEISAPPRLFIVETPTGTAVDLGCAYTLGVDSAGNSSLVVTAGWVEFSDANRTSLIPAGFHAAASKRTGIGAPLADDAPEALVRAVHALEDSRMSDSSAVTDIIAMARRRDAVTLWHLLMDRRTGEHDQLRIFSALAGLVPPPIEPGHRMVYQDPNAMRLWWEKLPGTLPITPGWQRTLWTWWIEVSG